MPRKAKEQQRVRTAEKAFGTALKESRLAAKLSQEDLALESEYHRTYVSLLERGKMNPSLKTILGLARVLKTPAAKLVERTEALLKESSPTSRAK